MRGLIQNLFDGYTGDDDQQAIWKIVECLTHKQRQQLVNAPGFSVDDFDDEVDGTEWDDLLVLFEAAGVRTGFAMLVVG